MLSAAYRRADFPVWALELEPFRNSLLAVSGRLDAGAFGFGGFDPATSPASTAAALPARRQPAGGNSTPA
jgi:hypothetical protein